MAISFDTATNGGNTSVGTTLPFSHTCTGSNLILFVMATGNNTGVATDDITGATYDGAVMTLVNKTFDATDRYRYLFYLINPTSNLSKPVVITSSTSGGFKSGNSASYAGAQQTPPLDGNITNTSSSATTITDTLTTIADNCWTVMSAGVGGANASAGTGSTQRATSVASQMFDSNGAKTPAGSTSMTINTSDALLHPIMGIMASFAPFVAAPVNLIQGSVASVHFTRTYSVNSY